MIKEFGDVIQDCHHLVGVLVLVEDNDTRSFVGFCYDDVFNHPERLDSLKTFFCHLRSHPNICGFHSKREPSRLTWPLGRQAALWSEVCDGLVERIVLQNQQILPHA